MTGSSMNFFIIGLGKRALVHIDIIKSKPSFAVVGGYDICSDARDAVSNLFPTYDDLELGLKECSPTCIVITTPPKIRIEFFKFFTGIHSIRYIITEKPIALSLNEALAMYEFCEKNAIQLIVVHQSRFSQEFQLLKKSVQENHLGHLQFIKMSNYGNIFNQGSHAIDLLLWITQLKVLWVDATGNNDLSQLSKKPNYLEKDEDHPGDLWSSIYLRLESNLEVFLTCGILDVNPLPEHGPWMQRRISIMGTDGMAESQLCAYFREITKTNSQHFVTSPKNYLDSLKDFYQHILHSPESFSNQKEDNLHTLSVLLAVRASAVENKIIEIREQYKFVKPQEFRPSIKKRPLLTVILPMETHRDMGVEAVKSWIQQDIDAELYELIVVCHTTQIAIKPHIETLLRSHDRLIFMTACNEIHLCHHATTLANGQYYLFTESHCLSQPDTVRNAIEFFQTTSHPCFYPTTHSICKSNLAEFEARSYQIGFSSFSQSGSWAKVVLHAFGIRKEVYHALGGFDYRYNRFSYWLLAANISRGNYALVHASNVSVKHLFANSFSQINTFLNEIIDGECQFRNETRDKDFDYNFLGPTKEWNNVQGFDSKMYLIFLLAISKNWLLLRINRIKISDFIHLGTNLTNSAIIGLGKQYSLLTFYYLRQLRSRLRYYLHQNKEKKWKHFLKYQTRYSAFKRVSYALLNRINNSNSCFFGFHSPEKYQDESFRWSSNLSAIKLNLPNNHYNIRIKILNLRPFDLSNYVFFLGTKLISHVEINHNHTEIKLNLKQRLQNNTWLFILAKPWESTEKSDSRKLGLAIQYIY